MKILRTIFIVLVIAGIAAFTYWYFAKQNTSTASTALTGSGTVETVQVNISPEITGKIVEVSVSDGDSVKVGDTLFKLDDSLLSAQHDQAQANLSAAQAGLEAASTALAAAQAGVTTAQAQYDLALATARQQSQLARSTAWSQSQPTEFNQPAWYYTQAEEITATQQEVNAAHDALIVDAEKLDSMLASSTYTGLSTAETRLANARSQFLDASTILDQARAQSNTSLEDAAQTAFDNAKTELEAAQQAYDELMTTQEAQDILDARARLAVAQQRYDTAIDRYNAQLTGEHSLGVKAASEVVAQAQANATAAESKVTQAQKAIDQAQAAVNLIEVQLGKLVITAPVDGAVLARNIEPGEVVLAGATALTLGQLDHLTITVYIPENRYGEVKLGDRATVAVDSFPGMVFKATVTRIADQASFTPRNVQTTEGRQTTVFGIQLSVEDPGGLLIPGMPADVTFGQP